MTEFGDISDFIWLGFVAVWLLLRILPRLFRSRPQSAAQSAERPGTQSRPARRPLPEQSAPAQRMPPQMSSPRQDPETDRALRTAKPIEPR